MISFLKDNLKDSVILSNKDERTISELFRQHDIQILPDNIFSRDITDDKNKKIKLIIDKTGVSPNELVFIDDNFRNLKDALLLGVRCYIASWGYNNPIQLKESENLGINVLTLDSISILGTQA